MDAFDWRYYLAKYPDLRADGVQTEQQAIQHWLNFGKKEGRVSIKTPHHFDWHYYLDKYPDLRADGVHTEQQAIQHWLDFGKKEGRVSIKTPHHFGWHYYLAKYPDLRANGIHTEQQAIQHWLERGKKEGRVSIKTPHNFGWHYYLDKYPDLRADGVHTEQQAIQHWLNFGKKEGRNSIGTTCGFAISTYHRNNDRLESFKTCISSIMKYKKADTVVILVDDGSSVKEHVRWVKTTFPTIIVIEKETNSGIAKCKNTCLRMLYNSPCAYFFLLDDDIEILQPIEDKYILSLSDENVHILSGASGVNHIISSYSTNTNITQLLQGYLLCFTKQTFIKSGYFKVFPSKYGHEHTWYTYRVMKHNEQTYFLDIKNSVLYTNIIPALSSICDEQKTHDCNENTKFMQISNYDYQNCIE
jgi:uncharacterized protein (DUF3820 family)